MSIITTVKDKILKNCILARILPPARIQGQKVVLARKIEKQGLGSTPDLALHLWQAFRHFTHLILLNVRGCIAGLQTEEGSIFSPDLPGSQIAPRAGGRAPVTSTNHATQLLPSKQESSFPHISSALTLPHHHQHSAYLHTLTAQERYSKVRIQIQVCFQ